MKDFARAKTFYAQLFGWSFGKLTFGGFLHDRKGWSRWRLSERRREEPGAGDVKVFFQVEDVERDLARAKSLGVEILLEPTPVSPTRTLAEFRDPDGNIIAIIHDSGGHL